MALTVNDWIWTRLSARYGVTPAQQQVGDVFKRWLDERGGSWGFALSDFYLASVPSATNYGDAEFAYWSGGALAQSVVWLDAFSSQSGSQTAVNLGETGSVYSARYGSATGVDTNDPLLLPHTGTNYLYLSAVNGNYASAPNSVPLGITGDIEIVARVALGSWIAAAERYIVGRWGAAGNRSFQFGISVNGRPLVYTSADGTTAIYHQTTVVPSLTDGVAYWFRTTVDVDDGAGNHVVRFYYASDQANEPSTWTQIGTDVVAVGATSILAGTAPVELGSNAGGINTNWSGNLYRSIIRNGIGGTTVFDANFTTGITSGAQTTFTESSVNAATVTINRSVSGRKAVAVVRPVWLFGTDDYMEVAADPEGAYVTLAGATGSNVTTPYQSLDTGTATSATATTLVDTTKTWVASGFYNRQVRITGGTGAGQRRRITTNTATELTVAAWTVTPDATSTYIIESAFNITDDIEIVCRIAMNDWTPASIAVLASRRTAGNFSWQLSLNSSGSFSLNVTTDGSTAIGSSSAVPSAGTFVDGQTYWLKVTRTASTGVCTWQYAADQSTEPSSWTTITASVNGAAGSMFGGTASLNIGDYAGWPPLAGKVYRVIVRDGIGGTLGADWAAYGHTATKASYADDRNNTWTINGVATTIANTNRLNFGATDDFTVVVVRRMWATAPASAVLVGKLGGSGSGWHVRNGGATPTQTGLGFADGTLSNFNPAPNGTVGQLEVLAFVATSSVVTSYLNTTPLVGAARTVGSVSSALPLAVGRFAGGPASYNDYELVAVAVVPKALTAADVTAICKLYGTA